MLSELSNGGSLNGGGRIDGGWHALAKLMFFCCGCSSGSFRSVNRPSPGHLVQSSRFSKTSGRSFLAKSCKGDLLSGRRFGVLCLRQRAPPRDVLACAAVVG
ncbi:hypothetical protein LINPERHAP1_LOCUS23319 [Linum perenne]